MTDIKALLARANTLMSLSSRDALNWCWHDDDHLMLFIERERLARGDFSNIRSDAG
ncbi:MAG: DUF1963 domain-containing protein [Myxococcota bacterium]